MANWRLSHHAVDDLHNPSRCQGLHPRCIAMVTTGVSMATTWIPICDVHPGKSGPKSGPICDMSLLLIIKKTKWTHCFMQAANLCRRGKVFLEHNIHDVLCRQHESVHNLNISVVVLECL